MSTRTSQRDGCCSQTTLCSSCHYHQYLLHYSCYPQWAVIAFFTLHSYIQDFSVAGRSKASDLVPLQSPCYRVICLFFLLDQRESRSFKAAIKQEHKATQSVCWRGQPQQSQQGTLLRIRKHSSFFKEVAVFHTQKSQRHLAQDAGYIPKGLLRSPASSSSSRHPWATECSRGWLPGMDLRGCWQL